MARLFGLTSADVDRVRDGLARVGAGQGSQRPLARRRRGGVSQSTPGVGLSYAVIDEDLPAADLTGEFSQVIANAARMKTLSGTTGSITWNDDTDDQGQAITRDAANTIPSALNCKGRNLLAAGVVVDGIFVVWNLFDMSVLTGYSATEAQAPYHEGGSREMKLGRDDC